jgi:hypothetical protein
MLFDPSSGLKSSAKSISDHLINHIQYAVPSWSWIICWPQHEPHLLPFLAADARFDLARTSASSPIRGPSLRITAHKVARRRHDIPTRQTPSQKFSNLGLHTYNRGSSFQTSTSHPECARWYDSETPTTSKRERCGSTARAHCALHHSWLEVQRPKSMISMGVVVGYVAAFYPARQHQIGAASLDCCLFGWKHFLVAALTRDWLQIWNLWPPPWISVNEWHRAQARPEITNLWRVRNIRRDRDMETKEARPLSWEGLRRLSHSRVGFSQVGDLPCWPETDHGEAQLALAAPQRNDRGCSRG